MHPPRMDSTWLVGAATAALLACAPQRPVADTASACLTDGSALAEMLGLAERLRTDTMQLMRKSRREWGLARETSPAVPVRDERTCRRAAAAAQGHFAQAPVAVAVVRLGPLLLVQSEP